MQQRFTWTVLNRLALMGFLLFLPSLAHAQAVPVPATTSELGAATGGGGGAVVAAETTAEPRIPLLVRGGDSGLMFNPCLSG